jgi:ribosomal protein S25
MIKLRKEGLVKTIGKEGRSVIYVRATRRVRSEHECDVNTPKARELETKVKKEGYRSLRELAKKLGVSHEYARQVITARKLHDKKVGEYTEEYRQMKKLAQRLVRVLKKLRRDRQRESDRLFRSQIEPFPQDYDPRGGRNAKRIR